MLRASRRAARPRVRRAARPPARTAGVLVEVRGAAHEQGATVRAAEHAREHTRAGRDLLDDLAALADAEHPPPVPSASHRQPSASSPQPSGATTSCGIASPSTDVLGSGPNSAQVRRLVRLPSPPRSNAVTRLPKVSSTSSTPSGVITLPLGNQRSSATSVTVPSGSTRSNTRRGDVGPAHQVEAEVADVGTALGVHHHVVRVAGDVARTGQRARRARRRPRDAGSSRRAWTRRAAARRAASRGPTAAAGRMPPASRRSRPRASTAPRRCRSRRPRADRRASAGTRGRSVRTAPW